MNETRALDLACLRLIADFNNGEYGTLAKTFAIPRPERKGRSIQQVTAQHKRQVTEAACERIANRLAHLEHAIDKLEAKT